MLRRFSIILLAILGLGVSAVAPAKAQGTSDQDLLVDRARIVVESFKTDPNFANLEVYAQNAFAMIIVPDMLAAGFLVGAEYGKGVMVVRDIRSGQWSNPAFFDLYSGSLGLQFGGKASDAVFTVMNQGAVDRILTNGIQLGTDASVAAGPYGAGVGAGTTLQFGEDIYAFNKGKGLFGGLSVEGTWIRPALASNTAFYGRELTAAQIFADPSLHAPSADRLREALSSF